MIRIKRPLSAAVIPAALLSTAAIAQDATVTPPPVVTTAPTMVPAPAAPVIVPPPVVSTNPTPTAAPEAPVVEDAPATVAAQPRTTRPTRQPAAPRAEAPAASASTVAPVTAAPVAEPVAPPAPQAANNGFNAPVDPTPAPEAGIATTTTETETSDSWWLPLAAIAAALIAGAAFMIARRRRRERDDAYYEAEAVEPVYAEPVIEPAYAAIPAAAAVAPEPTSITDQDHAEVVEADAAEVAAIAAADAPESRPWIELSFRPVRAGASSEAAQVDIELTLGNAGGVAAEDVRVSTFMLGDRAGAPTEMEQLLAHSQGGTEVNAGSIAPGEGSRVDASLAVPRHDLNGGEVQPVVVADVRYRLPDGSEGRTAASFVVGATDDGSELQPLPVDGELYEGVGAALHGELERA